MKPNLAKKWVDNLGSLLYRDERANKGIRVRHTSISDFLVNEYQVNLGDANGQLGIASLEKVVKQPLEDSWLPNIAVQDLPP